MNKVILIVLIIFLLGAAVSYFLMNNGYQDQSITSETAIKVDPPQDWYLWEVVSASMNMDDDTSEKDVSVQQEYLSNWIRENSNTLVFTSSSVDFQDRDLSTLLEYSNQRVADPLVHDVIVVNFSSLPTDFSVEEQDTENITVMYPIIDGNQVSYKRIKAFSTHDVASISIPTIENGSVMMLRNIAKNLSDEEALATFAAFEIK